MNDVCYLFRVISLVHFLKDSVLWFSFILSSLHYVCCWLHRISCVTWKIISSFQFSLYGVLLAEHIHLCVNHQECSYFACLVFLRWLIRHGTGQFVLISLYIHHLDALISEMIYLSLIKFSLVRR
jgi:hypothetical protein